MYRCYCWLAKLSSLVGRRGIGVVSLYVLNAVHLVIHGTPLDGGALDGLIVAANAWAVTEASR